MVRRVLVVGLALVLVLGVVSQGCFAKKLISIAATGQASSYYAYHVAVAQLLNKNVPEIQVSVLETGGSVDNLKRVSRGEAEWGQFAEPDFYEAYKGIGLHKGNPHSDLRIYWMVNPIVYYYVVRADSGVETLHDLSGKNSARGELEVVQNLPPKKR